ncbi:MAG: SUMF1/EgtB/PvdO family nonheme iron enzyme [Planctomycetales bacterium]|nr:SUMF1/EgtB/PvdO family nonheme iron enzyme [Planctomycetales bacterium]
MIVRWAMRLWVATCAAVMVFDHGAYAQSMEFVTVGNPGNPADFRHDPSGFGRVDYTYRIAETELTVGQYREFLNAKAGQTDEHGLFNPFMAFQGNITRIGSGTVEDPYTYWPPEFDFSLDALPVNFIGIWDVARFANWMHNGQGDGDTETGAYNHLDELLLTREADARYFIPTEDEWYKAAYFDPAKPGGPGYWEYPTRSDSSPTAEPPPGLDLVNGSANFGTFQLTPVGAYTHTLGPYGTYDQGGNLWEWNETIVLDDQGFFGLRGGSFDNIYGLEASHQDSYPGDLENPIMGARLAASVPEPSACLLALVSGIGVVTFRRGRHDSRK